MEAVFYHFALMKLVKLVQPDKTTVLLRAHYLTAK